MKRMARWMVGMLAMLAAYPVMAAEAAPKRIAVISAFEPEWVALQADMTDRHEEVVNGTRFLTGTLGGKRIVLFLSGVSMVNAAMTTQLALDRFPIDRIVFSGVAGGIDPKLEVGDVVVADRWSQYLESVFARQSGTGWAPPPGDASASAGVANYGMIFPRSIAVARKGATQVERRLWFPADPALLAIARTMKPVTFKRCLATLCLAAQPRLVVGGNGVSGPVFMDNAEYRQYLFRTFDAQVLDMETAAVAQVAYSNAVPFIAFRSLSDLAGGDPGENQAKAFYRLASDNSALVVTAFLKALPE